MARSPGCRTGCRCLPTCWPGTTGSARHGQCSTPRSQAGRPKTIWSWLPEVMRARAAHDEEPAAIARLRAAAQLASDQGSVALLRRCEHDLAERGVLAPVSAFRTSSERAPARERCANGAGPSFGAARRSNSAPEGEPDDRHISRPDHNAIPRAGRRVARCPDRAGRSRVRRRARRLQRHDRQASRRDRPLPGRRRRHRVRTFRPRPQPGDRRPRRRSQRCWPRRLGRRPGHRPLAAAQHHGEPAEAHRPRRCRMHLG